MMTGVTGTPLKILYFAWVREKTGRASEDVMVPKGVDTIAELVTWLKSRGPEFEAAFARGDVIRAAIDQTHVKPAATITGAREVAFFPPVTGG
ncbi:MAG: molybdopterin converting factor subunit 1 [Hyphomicrobium sp.]